MPITQWIAPCIAKKAQQVHTTVPLHLIPGRADDGSSAMKANNHSGSEATINATNPFIANNPFQHPPRFLNNAMAISRDCLRVLVDMP